MSIDLLIDKCKGSKAIDAMACGRNVQQVVKAFVFIYLHSLSEYFHGIVTCPRPVYRGLVVLVFLKNGNFMSRSTIESLQYVNYFFPKVA